MDESSLPATGQFNYLVLGLTISVETQLDNIHM